MATTIVACALRHDQAVIAHVGDSRCYQVRDGVATQLTRDHTWVNEQRKLGLITAAEAEQSEQRHVLTRCLGPELFVTVDTTTASLKPGDTLVLCSDGLYGAMYPEDIARLRFAGQGRRADCDGVGELCGLKRSGSDNATAQVIQVKSIEAMGHVSRAAVSVAQRGCSRSAASLRRCRRRSSASEGARELSL